MLQGLLARLTVRRPPKVAFKMRSSLESLMPADISTAPARSLLGDLGAFIGIGLGATLGFIALSGWAMTLSVGMPAWAVSALCYAAFIVPVYLLHRRFSFGSDSSHGTALPRYAAVQGLALLLAALFSFIAYGILSVPGVMASTLVIVLTSGVNFVVLRSWAFVSAR